MPPQTTSAAPGSHFSFERGSAWALLVTLILGMVVIIPSSSVPFLSTKVFVLAGGAIITLAFYILARLTRGNLIVPPLALFGALWLPALAYALSTLFSGVNPSSATFGAALEPDTLGFMLVATFLGSLAALVLRMPSQYKLFFKTLAYAFGVVLAVQIVILVVGQFAPNTVSPALSIVGSMGDLGILLGLGVVSIMLMFRLTALASRVRTILMVFGALSLLLLAVINSTLVWTLVALVALALFVEAVMRRAPHSSENDLEGTVTLDSHDTEDHEGNRPLGVPLAVLAVSLFFLIGGTFGNALAAKLGINVLTVRPSWQATLAVGSEVYGESPVFGSGPSTFGTKWLQFRDTSLNQTIFWNVGFTSGVGFVPTSFVTTGILGALAWIIFFGAFLYFGIRTLIFRAATDPETRTVAIFSFVGACYLFTTALFDLPSATLLALAFVLAGVFTSTMRFAQGGGQWGISFARNPRVGFVIVFSLTLLLLASIGAAYALVGRYIAQVDLARAGAAASVGDLTGAEAALAHSISFAPSASAYGAQAQIAEARLRQIAASTTISSADASRTFQAALSTGINAAL